MLRFFSTRYFEVLIFGVAMGLLFFFACHRLTESPPIWFDEGFFSQVGMNLAEHGSQLIQVAPQTYVTTSYMSSGYPLFVPLALSYTLFGVGVLQGRAVMVVFMILLALAAYLFLRPLTSGRQALLSLLLLVTFPELYGNGKSVLGEVPGLFFLFACLGSLFYLEQTRYKDWRWYGAVGLTAGLCAATKPIFILILPALFLAYLMRARSISFTLQGFLAGVVALITPLALWVHMQFGSGVSLQWIVAAYANPYAINNVWALAMQNALRFVTEITPIYTALLLLVWGAALFLRRKSGRTSSAELTGFFFCILIIASYLRLEGWYRYFFPATIVALPFLPSALGTLFGALQKRIRVLNSMRWIVVAGIVLLSCAQLYQTARTSFAASYFESTQTRDLSEAIASFDPHSTFFIYNVPELTILLPSHNYYQYLVPRPDVILGAGGITALQQGVPDVVIVNADAYQKDPSLFSRYTESKEVGAYDFLVKKPAHPL